MSLVRQSRGGKAYDSRWGTRMRGTGPYAEMLRIRFERARHRFGLERAARAWQLDTTQLPPPGAARRSAQLVLRGTSTGAFSATVDAGSARKCDKTNSPKLGSPIQLAAGCR